MTALRSPLQVAASLVNLFCCVTCAARLRDDKGYEPQKGSIELGTECEVHPIDKPRCQATAIVLAPESERTTPEDDLPAIDREELDEILPPGATTLPRRIDVGHGAPMPMGPLLHPVPFGANASTMGPVTEIATRLIVAWSTADKIADKYMVDEAIATARDIVRKTGGA
jgi:hypothetical protein